LLGSKADYRQCDQIEYGTGRAAVLYHQRSDQSPLATFSILPVVDFQGI
jgi:hypothetical protein